MDFFEDKNNNLLSRLRLLRSNKLCQHINKEIGLWCEQAEPHPEGTQRTIECFLSNIKHLENYDSDATESTSSDDYDELEGFSHEDIKSNNLRFHQQRATINCDQDFSDLKAKAIWKWAHERSSLAARWTWLQAQVADLEFRIRGQNDATMVARAHKTAPLPPQLPEESCSRTVPLSKDFRRRRLIKSSKILSESTKKLVKFSHVPCICSSLPQTVAPCLSCNGRYNYLRQIDGENVPTSERISILDPCYHPVLSSTDDLTLGSQMSYLLKKENINRKPVKGRPGRKKGSTKAAQAASHAILTSNKVKRKYRKHHLSSSNNPNINASNHHPKINPNWSKKRIRRASSMNESSESSNQNVTRRRRSDAYDIDNIVIPFSIAATTRVEILEYKEIMTPSWRVWENGTCQNDTIEEDIEDISDEAYVLRHSKGESEEKKRFSLKPPKNTATTINSNNSKVNADPSANI